MKRAPLVARAVRLDAKLRSALTSGTRGLNDGPAKSDQLDKFKETARDLETDDDEARFDERVRKLVKHKPMEKPSV
jgi:hypothetical protein